MSPFSTNPQACRPSDHENAPPVQRGDLLAVFSAGAYGFVMASQYNSRPCPPGILVDADTFKTIRPRETYGDLLRGES